MRISSTHSRWLPTALASAAILGCGGSGSSEPPVDITKSFRSAGVVYAAPTVGSDQSISVQVLTASGVQTLKTAPVDSAKAATVQAALVPGNLVDWVPGTDKNSVKVASDAAATFNVILAKGSSSAAQFNLAKYGASVTRNENVPGPMVAAGWIYNKGAGTITIGDGRIVTADMAGRAYPAPIKRYEETYNVSPDVKVFNVNTANYASSAASDFAAIPVTADYNYATTSRQAAYLLFDNNYQNADKAKVVAIWYFTPKSTADGKPVWDVPTQSPLLADKGNDPVSGQPFATINATGVTQAPYTRSTEPFEIVKGTMYYVGDNEVASYVLKADMGTADPSDDRVIKVDAGWPNSGYQYWKNMELLGLDPRSVTDSWLTHAHGDHYGTIVEQVRMMDNAGKPVRLWGSKEDIIGITSDLQGNAWNIAGTLPASETEIRARTTNYYEFDKWYDYGNVQIKVIWSPGHTTGTTNMLFKVKNPTDGKFYTFGYHGGYGVNGMEAPTAANGWRRLAWQHGFSYLQNTIDTDFVSPQHTNQFPIVEVYQALKAYNRDPANAGQQLTMLDALRSRVFDSPQVNGVNVTTEFANQLEKRRSVITYAASDAANTRYKSIETSGPFKPGRETGLTNVTAKLLDGGKIVQGFVGAQNKNPRIPLLANGIPNATDGYTNDPAGFFVQVAIDVQDAAYKGFLPEGFTQFSPGMNATITYQGGPIESTNAAKGTYHPPEYLRTQRLNSLADAQAILASIAAGRTVTLSLTRDSQIVVPTDVTKTFR
ncbi:MBL fold metallo-hydrolase [Ramlibacter sp. XY19]|uniref:MBL fold metallo-hydrolase n=1 Tax=Ramlibacter paludis TaxID=2908000 RepID=UPI0023DC536B|nr:MBL fold metallo-hydrolase [Ramlibacter paludis]MCG2591884.1 MBL fold metallo-hydrolase [Ramlibacter paludis]